MSTEDREIEQPEPELEPAQNECGQATNSLATLEKRLDTLEGEVARASAAIEFLLAKSGTTTALSQITAPATNLPEPETQNEQINEAIAKTAAVPNLATDPPRTFKSPMLQGWQPPGQTTNKIKKDIRNHSIAEPEIKPTYFTDNISNNRLPNKEAPAQESLETRIGLYWLNRIGISVLVIGLALLIIYSFNHFGALAKLLFGFASGALLIGTGEWLDKRKNLSWYTRSLSGGGWAIIYFSTYAMHFVPSVAILSSQIIDLLLLLTVAAGSIAHAVYKNSELAALLGIMLGLATIAMGNPDTFSWLASGILTISAAILAIKTGWARFLTWTCLSAYFTFNFLSPSEKISALGLPPHQALWLVFSYVVIYWLSYVLATCFAKKTTSADQFYLVRAATINAFGFLYSLFPWLERAYPGELQYMLLAMGIIYAATLYFLKKSPHQALAVTHSLLALLFCTLYIPAAVKGLHTITILAVEVSLLTFLGLKYNLRSFRWFALPLSTLVALGALVQSTRHDLIYFLGITYPAAFLSIFICFLCLAFSACRYQLATPHDSLTAERKDFGFYWHYTGAMLTAWLLPFTLATVEPSSLTNANANNIQLLYWSLLLYINTRVASIWRKEGMMIYSWLIATILAGCALSFRDTHWLAACVALLSLYIIPIKIKEVWNKQALVDFALLLSSGTLWLYTVIHYSGHHYGHTSGYELPALLAIEALGNLYLSKKLSSTTGEFITCFGFASAGFSLIPLQNKHWLSTIALTGSLYTASLLYWHSPYPPEKKHAFFRLSYGILGTFILTTMLAYLLPGSWISIAWTIEACALLILGFSVRRKLPRIGGLIIFALVVLKLLLWDMAHANTLLRIISFIGAGLLLLLFSFIYAHFAAKMMLSEDKHL